MKSLCDPPTPNLASFTLQQPPCSLGSAALFVNVCVLGNTASETQEEIVVQRKDSEYQNRLSLYEKCMAGGRTIVTSVELGRYNSRPGVPFFSVSVYPSAFHDLPLGGRAL